MQNKDIPIMILAGGRGTRLMEETREIPKPMVTIGGKPILLHLMQYYSRFGFRKFIVCLGYKGEIIKEYFLNVRERILDAIPTNLRYAVSAGIGMFIAFIGLKNAGLIAASPGTFVTLNVRVDPAALAVFAAGLLTASALQARAKRGAVLAGILVAAGLALALCTAPAVAGQSVATGAAGRS